MIITSLLTTPYLKNCCRAMCSPVEVSLAVSSMVLSEIILFIIVTQKGDL